MSNPRTVIRLHRIIAALAIGFAVLQTFQLAAIRADFRDTIAANRTAIYGVTYALNREQEKAGRIKWQSMQVTEKLDEVSGSRAKDVNRLQQRIGEYQTRLDQCRATNAMLSKGR